MKSKTLHLACLLAVTAQGIAGVSAGVSPNDKSRAAHPAMCVRQTRDGGYIVTGTNYVPSPPPYGTRHLFLAKLAPERTR